MKQLQIKKILIPTDFSKTGLLAIEHAAFMTRISKATLYLLHTVELSETTFGIYDPAIAVPDLSEVDKIAASQLKKLAVTIGKQYGIVVKTICTRGKAAYEIVNAVKENKIDIVVMGTHGASGFNEYFIGSNAHKTVTICPCPVISIQASTKKLGFTDIVLPIDDNFDSRQKVDATISLAKKYAAKIYVLGLLGKDDDANEKTFKIKLHSVEKVIEKSGLAYETKTVKGDNLAIAALKYSKKVKADLIVVLTGQESQLTGMFLGSFAKQIVNHSKIPIMSIRPSDLGLYDSVSLAGSNSI